MNSNRSLDNFYHFLRFKLSWIKSKYYDWRLGIKIRTNKYMVEEDIGLYEDAHSYTACLYGRLERMVDYLKLTPNDVFVDLGCGEGRAVFFIATYKIKKAVGVELDRHLFDIAQKNLERLRIKRTPIELFNIDAINFDAKEATIFCLCNPFGYKTFKRVMDNIKESLITNPRSIRILYYGPEFKDLLNDQEWLFQEGKIKEEDCLVWRNKPL